MDLKEKRKLEMDLQKENRREQIIKAAIDVFKEQGIDNTKMVDVAQRAQFGVATVYRYFKNKTELVIASATWLWDEELSNINALFYKESFSEHKAIDRIRKILTLFLDMYLHHSDILGFLEQFDNYVVKNEISSENLESYETSVISIKKDILQSMAQGKIDGSIKEGIDENLFYITATHSLMSLCQKLILRGKIISKDDEIAGYDQISLLIEMLLSYIHQPQSN